MKFRKNYNRSKIGAGTINKLPSMTKQEFEDELEINKVMQRYVETGYIPRREIAGLFGDFSIPMDFDTVQDKLLRANALFVDLPLDVRDEFRTAEEFIKAFQTDRGRAKLESVGVLQRKPAETPVAGSGAQSQEASKDATQVVKNDPAS